MVLPTTPPLYTLAKDKKRALIPKAFILLFLGTIFYLGVLLNLSLLELTSEQENTARLTAGILIIALIGAGFINALSKAKALYYFYQDQIIYRKSSIFYQSISSIERKEKLTDKIFKTYSLVLNNQFQIKYIPQQANIQDYIEKMQAYSSGRAGMMSEMV